MDGLIRDLRMALRGFGRAPATITAMVSILGVAIGMAIAMATVSNAVLASRLPVTDQDRLIVLWPFRDAPIEMPVFRADVDRLRQDGTTLRGVASVTHWGTNAVPWRACAQRTGWAGLRSLWRRNSVRRLHRENCSS